jgi:hypothetical protein
MEKMSLKKSNGCDSCGEIKEEAENKRRSQK